MELRPPLIFGYYMLSVEMHVFGIWRAGPERFGCRFVKQMFVCQRNPEFSRGELATYWRVRKKNEMNYSRSISQNIPSRKLDNARQISGKLPVCTRPLGKSDMALELEVRLLEIVCCQLLVLDKTNQLIQSLDLLIVPLYLSAFKAKISCITVFWP